MGKQLSTDKAGQNGHTLAPEEHPFGGSADPDPRNVVAEVASSGPPPDLGRGPGEEPGVPAFFDEQAYNNAIDKYMSDEVDAKNIDDTMDWVGDDAMRARVVLERENADDSPRSTLVARLTRLTEPAE